MAPSRTAAKSKSAQPRISTFFGKASASAVNAQKSTNKPNGSILKFFQKVEPPTSFDRSLFVDAEASENVQTHTIDDSHQLLSEDELRFNENGYPQKRRRTRSSDELEPQYETDPDDAALPTAKSMQAEESKEKHYPNVGASDTSEINTGPFAEDSESENGEDLKPVQTLGPPANSEESKVEKMSIEDSGADPYLIGEPTKPSLKRESTSFLGHDNFEEFEDFDGEEFYEQGEEYLERRYMEEQAALEREFEDSACDDFREPQIQPKAASPPDANESYCPICDSSLSGVSTEVWAMHRFYVVLTYPRMLHYMLITVLMASQPHYLLGKKKKFLRQRQAPLQNAFNAQQFHDLDRQIRALWLRPRMDPQPSLS